jgi:AcrR family transcriptional regulator
MLTRTAVSLKGQVLDAARKLFMERGYDAIGMRDIAEAVGRQPVQVYRLKLSKADILAELIIELNQEQIDLLPTLCKRVRGTAPLDRTCSYLRELYKLDIQYLPIRSVGAAFGWMWAADHERRVVEQVGQIVSPVVQWMQDAGLEDVQARIIGIWSLYYVGYRHAVIHGGSARDCLKAIKPSLRYYFQ